MLIYVLNVKAYQPYLSCHAITIYHLKLYNIDLLTAMHLYSMKPYLFMLFSYNNLPW